MPKTVTYRGPREKVPYPSEYVVPDENGKDVLFAENVPVSDVHDDVAERLANTTGHRFDVEPDPVNQSAGKPGSKS